ncbi:hypothetical protein AVEN_81363-1 [Araneus ventricosus]|uniref:Uncharacterized protein n=1 Tax=Araneus ventricosus TaxID=182803 RepID=A0A4Y2B6C6_ARAVE|nr:hypothetical protein AVEN_81363-1 [Araneus ventricosus]
MVCRHAECVDNHEAALLRRRATSPFVSLVWRNGWSAGRHIRRICLPLDLFLMGPSQANCVSRRSGNTNGLSCSSSCLYFGCDPAMLQHVMTAIPRRAQAASTCTATLEHLL